MSDGWLAADLWRTVQDAVPVACCDVLPVDVSSGKVGLIFRHTPDEGDKWGLVGGRVLRNESLADAIVRQVMTTLGGHSTIGDVLFGPVIGEYFTDGRGRLRDPRQHALGITFAVAVSGEVHACGEAIDFAWWDPSALPSIGFGQELLVDELCLGIGLLPG